MLLFIFCSKLRAADIVCAWVRFAAKDGLVRQAGGRRAGSWGLTRKDGARQIYSCGHPHPHPPNRQTFTSTLCCKCCQKNTRCCCCSCPREIVPMQSVSTVPMHTFVSNNNRLATDRICDFISHNIAMVDRPRISVRWQDGPRMIFACGKTMVIISPPVKRHCSPAKERLVSKDALCSCGM